MMALDRFSQRDNLGCFLLGFLTVSVVAEIGAWIWNVAPWLEVVLLPVSLGGGLWVLLPRLVPALRVGDQFRFWWRFRLESLPVSELVPVVLGPLYTKSKRDLCLGIVHQRSGTVYPIRSTQLSAADANELVGKFGEFLSLRRKMLVKVGYTDAYVSLGGVAVGDILTVGYSISRNFARTDTLSFVVQDLHPTKFGTVTLSISGTSKATANAYESQ